MKFAENYLRALELLPESERERFNACLVGCLAYCVGSVRRDQALEAALYMCQDFKPGLHLVKGSKCQTR